MSDLKQLRLKCNDTGGDAFRMNCSVLTQLGHRFEALCGDFDGSARCRLGVGQLAARRGDVGAPAAA